MSVPDRDWLGVPELDPEAVIDTGDAVADSDGVFEGVELGVAICDGVGEGVGSTMLRPSTRKVTQPSESMRASPPGHDSPRTSAVFEPGSKYETAPPTPPELKPTVAGGAPAQTRLSKQSVTYVRPAVSADTRVWNVLRAVTRPGGPTANHVITTITAGENGGSDGMSAATLCETRAASAAPVSGGSSMRQ